MAGGSLARSISFHTTEGACNKSSRTVAGFAEYFGGVKSSGVTTDQLEEHTKFLLRESLTQTEPVEGCPTQWVDTTRLCPKRV
jgi:hypothetical protein